jgi:two-component system nitrogen regulation response regulator GlnG
VKLLRVLEHGEILPVGADRPVQSDFRVISATHRNLAQRVAEGSFRHDLYFRLITFEIELPPLRERGGDVVLLADRFLDLLSARSGIARPSLSAEVREELTRRPWHGNVRELRNAIEHAMILARGGQILLEHLPPPAPSTIEPGAAPGEAIASWIHQWTELELQSGEQSGDLYDRFVKLVEPPLLTAVMEHCRGQCAAAARELGLHRTTLRRKLDEFGIDNT